MVPVFDEERKASRGRAPLLDVVRPLVSTLGSWGALCAALAALAGFAGSILGGFALLSSIERSEISGSHDQERRLVSLVILNRQLMAAIDDLSSNPGRTSSDGAAVRQAWRSFDRTRGDFCRDLAPAAPTTDALRAVCTPSPELHAVVGPEIERFSPPDRLLSPAALKRLRRLHADVMQMHDDVLRSAIEFEEGLAEHYGFALWVLTASAFTSALSALALLYFVRGASARYDAKGQEAARQYAQIHSIVESSGAPILLVDRDLHFVLGNREFHKLGLPGQENANPFHLDDEQLARWRNQALPDPCEPVLYATDLVDGAGRRRLLNVTATPIAGAEGRMQGIVFVAVDDTDRWQAQQALVERARYDRLTGLANRGYFFERARQNVDTAVHAGHGFAVLCLDIDEFSDVNSTMGYAMGDVLLKIAAARIRACLGPSDLASHFGADEFALMRMDVRDSADAEQFARQLRDSLSQPYEIGGTIVHKTTSIGLSVYGAERVRAEIAVGHADLALYRAKAGGLGGLAVYRPSLEREVLTRARLAQDMRQGLGAGQFYLVYQPRFDLGTNTVTGIEALVRWQHPSQGLLSPSDFIPVAESTGFILELGEWIIREACRQARLWREAGLELRRTAVNVSALQFRDAAGLEHTLDAALADAGLPPEALELEITETAFVEVTREHTALLRRLRARGITIAIDDFGTGYSSLLYLRSMPADRIKIAQVFVEGVATDDADATITQIAVRLGQGLGLKVVAEGVETPEQLAKLKLWNCDEAQGYLLAKPMPADQLAILLRATRLS